MWGDKHYQHTCDDISSGFILEDSRTPRGDLQVKEVLKSSTSFEPKDWQFSYIDFVLYDILPDDPKEAAAIRKKLIDSITMRSCRHYIADRMMESCSDAFLTKRNMEHSKKLMMVCVELINPDPNLETGSEDLAIIGRR